MFDEETSGPVPPMKTTEESKDETKSEGSEDASDANNQSEIARQNVLLKQLLQNCASAETTDTPAPPFLVTETTASDDGSATPAAPVTTETKVDPEVPSTETTEPPVVSMEEVVVKTEMIESASSGVVENPLVNPPEVVSESSQSSSQNPPTEKERKMSYLDIRRALLEREPTPPPGDVKPKRKRPEKREKKKEPKVKSEPSTVSSENESVVVNTSTAETKPQPSAPAPEKATPQKTTKKRARKASQVKPTESEDYDLFLSSLMSRLRNLPPMHIVEPQIKPNFNICVPFGCGDLNSQTSVIRGTYGQGFIPAGDPEKTVTPSQNHSHYPSSGNRQNAPNPSMGLRGFYSQEFARGAKPQTPSSGGYVCHLRDTESPHSIISSSSPENVMYDDTPLAFGQLRVIKEEPIFDEEMADVKSEKRCESPEIPILIPIPIKRENIMEDDDRISPRSSDSDPEKDKENAVINSKSGGGGSNSNQPLRDAGNVAVTLTLSSSGDIKRVLGALAKLLDIEPPAEFHVVERTETPPSHRLGLYDSRMSDKTPLSESRFCKFCDIHVMNESGNQITKKMSELRDVMTPASDKSVDGDEDVIFCDSNCYLQFAISQAPRIKSEKEDRMAGPLVDHHPPEGKMDLPPMSPMMEDDERNMSPEKSRKSSLVDAEEVLTRFPPDFDPSSLKKKWNGIKYLNWTLNTFEASPQHPVDEEMSDEIKSLLDNLCVNVMPNDLPLDNRQCAFCHEVGDGCTDGPGRLLNMDVDRWVHLNCALWSVDVYETLNGALVNVDVALKRAEAVACVKCHKMGATLKCFKHRCSNVYHMSCAISDKCMFLKDKSFYCPQHVLRGQTPEALMTCFSVFRRVYVNRDEHKQLANMIQDQAVMRIGSLVFLNIGQLLPQQLANFHTPTAIYPVGYKVVRFYWSRDDFTQRSRYMCTISDNNGHPEFAVEVDKSQSKLMVKDNSPRLVWHQVIEPIANMRKEKGAIKVFTDYVTGEDLFGLNELAVVRILESLPGVETLCDYNFRFGRSQILELPLAINPSGCARTEPKLRTHFKRPHTLHTSNPSRSSLQSSFTGIEVQSPYIKQFVHSKSSQYRKMKTEWRNNVYLARSRIAGQFSYFELSHVTDGYCCFINRTWTLCLSGYRETHNGY